MKQSQRRPSIFLNIILFVGLAVIWIAFAPAKIGGQASYVLVNGISMEPNYHTGDLVIVRKAPTYQVGDVVTYRDAVMGAFVIHRIVSIEQGQFVIKGDNNSWLDAYHPAPDEIVGKQWIHAPKFGIAMLWLRRPMNLLIVIVLLGGVLMTNMRAKSSKGQKANSGPSIRFGGMLEGTFYLLGALFVGFLALCIFAYFKPLTRAGDNISYQQDGNFYYSATGTPGVYDTEMVRTGEPIFPKLTCFLNIGFTYNILGGQLQNISGNQQMYARVMDRQSGWQRTIPMTPQTTFNGSTYFAMSTLDLCGLETLVNLMEKETGLRASTYIVEIVADAAFTASASGQPVTGTFEPSLAFNYDKVHLYLASSSADKDPMRIIKEGLAGSSQLQANTWSIFRFKPAISSIRIFALIGLGMALIGLLLAGLYVFNTASESESALIQLRYGHMLIEVYEQSLNGSLPVIDVSSIEDLVKMAERQNSMILLMTRNFLQYYLVQGTASLYRYVLTTGKSGVPAQEPVRQDVIKQIARKVDPIPQASQPVQRRKREYVINSGQISFDRVYPGESELERKVRI